MDLDEQKLPLLWGFRTVNFNVAAGANILHGSVVHPDFLEGSPAVPGLPLIEIQADEEVTIPYLSVELDATTTATFQMFDPSFEIDLFDGSQTNQGLFDRRALACGDQSLGVAIPAGANRKAVFEMPETTMRARDVPFSTGTLRFLSISFVAGFVNSGAVAIPVRLIATIALRRIQAARF